MPLRGLTILLFTLAIPLAGASAQESAQQPVQQPIPPNPGFTLHTSVRIVLADVTVTDNKGNVVHGLPASAFHVTIDKSSRPLASFEEHNVAPTAMIATPVAGADTFSNEYLLHLPPVLNIVVLDTSTLAIPEQMYLGVQFNQFLKQLPASQPLAIYARTGDHLVLIQNFTADHALLTAAASKVMPRIPTPHEVTSDVTLLAELAQRLILTPGRKNVLWFSGGSGVLQLGDPEVTEDEEALRQVYDELEAARIALYPIDARGLTTTVFDSTMIQQHQQMSESADATGGKAYFNMNSLKNIAQNVLKQDSSYYTLTVSPKDFTPDNKWHKILISLDKPGYNLSYRRGYFADGANIAPVAPSPDSHRNLLVAGGKTVDVPPDIHSAPIIFTASIISAAQRAAKSDSQFITLNSSNVSKRGHLVYFIRYTLPTGVFFEQAADGHPKITFDVAALAFNQSGERIGQIGDRVKLTLAPDAGTQPLCIEQQIDLPKGDAYLFLAVSDNTTGRLGTLQVPINVK